MKRVGVVGNSSWSSQRLAAVLERKTGFRCLIDMGRARLDLHRRCVCCNGVNLLDLDAIIVKKIGKRYSRDDLDRLEILRYVRQSGVSVFSNPESIIRLLDRLACTVTLQLNRIPMPPTVVTEDVDKAVAAVRQFKRAVFKPLFSTKARGMRVVVDGARAREAVERFRAAGNPVMYIQKMLDLRGRDLGMAFLGGRHLGTYARIAHEQAWNTTAHFGGRYQPYHPRDELIELARRAQAPFKLDFTCVDVAETDSGPVVFEVSAFGGFRGLKEAHGIDAAEHLADYVLERIGHA